jgi:hypothetical protein
MAGGEQLGPYIGVPTLAPSFHNADRPTHQRVMVVGLLFCVAFVAISFSLRPQPDSGRVLVNADRLVRTAGEPHKAN